MRSEVRYRGERVGWGPLRRDWLCFCPAHRRPAARWRSSGCRPCMAGSYVSPIAGRIGRVVYLAAPSLWRWWANRGRHAARPRASSPWGTRP